MERLIQHTKSPHVAEDDSPPENESAAAPSEREIAHAQAVRRERDRIRRKREDEQRQTRERDVLTALSKQVERLVRETSAQTREKPMEPRSEANRGAGGLAGERPAGVFGAQPVRIAPQEPLILAHPSQMRAATSPWASFWAAALTFFLGVVASSFPTAWPILTDPSLLSGTDAEQALQTYMFVGGSIGAIVTLFPALIGVTAQLNTIGAMLRGKQCEIDVATNRLVEVPADRIEPATKTWIERFADRFRNRGPRYEVG